MSETSAIATGLRRGVALRCPHCGKGRLFKGFLRVSDRCEVCGADNTIYPSDDAPPYVTLVLVLHALVPPMLWMDLAWSFPMWIMYALWLPLIAGAIIGALPYVKGAVIGYEWATGVTRASVRQ